MKPKAGKISFVNRLKVFLLFYALGFIILLLDVVINYFLFSDSNFVQQLTSKFTSTEAISGMVWMFSLAFIGVIFHQILISKREADIDEKERISDALNFTKIQLFRSQKMGIVGSFLNSVIHDFNNLLQIIDGHVRLIQIKGDQSEANYDAIREAMKQTNELIEQILIFSKTSEVNNKNMVDINKIIDTTHVLIQNLDQKNINYIFKTNPTPIYIKGNVSQINQILLNLIINSNDAMPNGGTITLETSYEEDSNSSSSFAIIKVTDTGEGMDEETKENIFDPFYTTKSGGTGLGLYTVSSIVQDNNGKIIVESEPGKGTTFKVYLPSEAPKQFF